MSALSAALHELQDIVGAANLLSDTERVANYRLEGQMPLAVALPSSPEQVAALLKAASSAGLSVLIRGAGIHLHLGAPPTAMGLVICMQRLDQIIEYDADDLTITAQAGVTLEALQAVVRQKGQMAPLDAAGPGSATLGGIAAANLSGPLRLRHGSPRDLLLGLRVALCDGSVINAGGKTVKNVAGYDLTKLFVGAMGTLGAICELTLRLAPSPEARAMIAASLPRARALEAAAQIAGSWLEPASLEIADPHAAERLARFLPAAPAGDSWLLLVGVLGSPEAIARQERELRSLLGNRCARVEGEAADALWGGLRALSYPSQPGAVIARAAVPITRPGELMNLVASWQGWWALAHSGLGIMHAGPLEQDDLAGAKQRLALLRAEAEKHGGFLILESGPPELKREFPVWGDQHPNLDLMTRLKQAYDPAHILGCGRFLPGL